MKLYMYNDITSKRKELN